MLTDAQIKQLKQLVIEVKKKSLHITESSDKYSDWIASTIELDLYIDSLKNPQQPI